MKKTLISLATVCAMATTLSADFTRIEMGVGAWKQKSSSILSYSKNGGNGFYDSNEKSDTTPYVWMLVKHPIPILPNLRLEYTKVQDKGKASGSFKDFNIGNQKTDLNYELKQYDIIPYYNILDNTAGFTLDLGLDIKIIDFSYDAKAAQNFDGYKDSKTVAIPLAYARARFDIPTTNIGLETDIKYITTGDSTVYDARAKVDYTLDFFPVIKPALEIGYRTQKYKIDESSVDFKTDIKFSGFYSGVVAKF